MNRTLKFIVAAWCLLLVPLIAEVLDVEGWDWKLWDFAFIGVLLAGFGASVAYATGPRTKLQRVIGALLSIAIVLLYVHLAVGIEDTWPLAGS